MPAQRTIVQQALMISRCGRRSVASGNDDAKRPTNIKKDQNSLGLAQRYVSLGGPPWATISMHAQPDDQRRLVNYL